MDRETHSLARGDKPRIELRAKIVKLAGGGIGIPAR
jgi:hypothetical protein